MKGVKEYLKDDMAKVKCSYCEEEMDCPKSMLKAEKHICHICTDLLADGAPEDKIREIAKDAREIEKYAGDGNKLTKEIFALTFDYHKPDKELIRELSKRELVEGSFIEGITATLIFMLRLGVLEPKDIRRISIIAEALHRVGNKKNFSPEEIDGVVKEVDEKLNAAE